MEPLSARMVHDSVVFPTIRLPTHPGKLLMGVYDADCAFVPGSELNRRAGEQGAPMPRGLFETVTESGEPEAIYLGPLYFHYGHFLLESLARTWYARRHPELPMVWAGAHNWQGVSLRPWQEEILCILGLTNATKIIADPTRFARLHMPDIGYRYDDRFHPEHAAFLAAYSGPTQISGHKLWLSRRKAGDVRDLNSTPTERRLSRAGWTVVHPETLDIRQQLDHLARAEVVAGEEGSAFHTLILLTDVASKRLEVFRRHGPEHGSMHTIGNARRLNQSFHTLSHERVLSAEGRVVSKINPNASEILDALRVHVPPAPEPDTRSDGNVILEHVIAELQPQRFLELGAAAPFVVVSSSAPARVAVCPRFAFDPRSFADAGVEFFELEAAGYANYFHGDREPFDLIRIVGHRLDWVLDAFRVSTQLAGSGSLWILGFGDIAARAALAIRLFHPGYLVQRFTVERRTLHVVRRASSEPQDESDVANLAMAEVQRRLRRLARRSLFGFDQLVREFREDNGIAGP